MANSKDLTSSTLRITTGISCKPAFCDASHLRSPAIISYFPSSALSGRTTIGCITPCSLIELVNSSKFSLSKCFLGCNLFLVKSFMETLFVTIFFVESPSKDDKPLPKPFFNRLSTIMQRFPLYFPVLKIHQ